MMSINHKDKLLFQLGNTEIYNQLSFIVIDSLSIAFKEIQQLLIDKNQNQYLNIVSIFYHHIIMILTSYIFCKYELELYNIKSKSELYNLRLDNNDKKQSIIDYEDIYDDDYRLTKNSVFNYKKNVYVRLKELKYYLQNYRKYFFIRNNKQKMDVLLGTNISIDKKNILAQDNLRIHFANKVNKIFIPVFDKQFQILINNLRNIKNRLINYELLEDQVFTNQFYNYLYRELKSWVSSKGIEKRRYDIVIVGSLGPLNSRLIAASAKRLNIPVISVWHGYSIGDKNEPVYGPVEQSFCDIILGYGDYGCKELQKGSYNNSLYNSKPKVIPSTSRTVKKIYKGEKISIIKNFSSERIIYVPTSFSGTNRYGPFRDMHDKAYLHWQDTMLRNVNKILTPKKILRKFHWKEKIKEFISTSGVENIYDINFINCLSDADIFIFDYLTSAFVLAAATKKPIIFFDIGLRNLMPAAKQSLKDRCIYIKGNINEAPQMVKKINNHKDKKCINNFTLKYSISKDPRKRESILSDIITESAMK